jgi:phenylpropionate dioxygenase-like ring-hydroxylating dioxygenase large terminal subunit
MSDALATPGRISADAYTDPAYFQREMALLGEHTWLFACFTDDLSQVDDWVRRSIAGVDVVVQNFRGELRAFENLCSHRFFPIRRTRVGNGTLRCGFHAWTFNREGVPTGIPRNAECFGLSREDQQRLALRRFHVATVGRFVFVSIGETPPPIRDYLGRYASLFEVLSDLFGRVQGMRVKAASANWKHCYELTLDDYHAQAVHPDSFGATVAPLHKYYYEREGLHSHMMRRRDPDWSFAPFWDRLPERSLDITGYKIFNVFPATYFVLATTHLSFVSLVPVAADQTSVESYFFDWIVAPDPIVSSGELARGIAKIHDEDVAIAEAMQLSSWRPGQQPLLGKLEERVAWFHDSYAQLVARGR